MQINLAIWDTAGQERFHALGPIYYRDADGALLVYDTTDAESFVKAKNWVVCSPVQEAFDTHIGWSVRVGECLTSMRCDDVMM